MLSAGAFLYINRFSACSRLSQRESQERFRTEAGRKKMTYGRNHRSVSMFCDSPTLWRLFFCLKNCHSNNRGEGKDVADYKRFPEERFRVFFLFKPSAFGKISAKGKTY